MPPRLSYKPYLPNALDSSMTSLASKQHLPILTKLGFITLSAAVSACAGDRFNADGDGGGARGTDDSEAPEPGSTDDATVSDDTATDESTDGNGTDASSSDTDPASPTDELEVTDEPGSVVADAGVAPADAGEDATPSRDAGDAAIDDELDATAPDDAAAPPSDAYAPGDHDAGPGDCESASCADASTMPSDECPEHPAQVLRGPCGCGFEPDERCVQLEGLLAHRYSFDGNGRQVTDSVGGAHGQALGVELDGRGVLALDGEDAYAELPPGVASAYSAATFEAWVRWDGGEDNQRIFNFGTPDGNNGVPLSYLSLSPASGSDNLLTASYRVGDASGQNLRGDDTLTTGVLQHIAVVVDSPEGEWSLVLQGELERRENSSQELQQLQDQVNWLGRALYSGYPLFRGELEEFRIYAGALTEEQLEKSFELGPSATFSR